MFENADFLFLARRRNGTSHPRSDWLLLILSDVFIGGDEWVCPSANQMPWEVGGGRRHPSISKIAKSPHRKDGERGVKTKSTGFSVQVFFFLVAGQLLLREIPPPCGLSTNYNSHDPTRTICTFK